MILYSYIFIENKNSFDLRAMSDMKKENYNKRYHNIIQNCDIEVFHHEKCQLCDSNYV